jgi:phosphatidate phosphatase APP1
MRHFPARQVLVGVLLLVWGAVATAWAGEREVTRLKSDESIEIYPTLGRRVEGSWLVRVEGRVFEREPRNWTLEAIERALDLQAADIGAEANRIFESRVRTLLTDGERGKVVWVEAGPARARMGESDADGSFCGELRLTEAEARLAAESNSPARARLRVVLPVGDGRQFAGEACLLDDAGVSVVSDIDDTIKVSDVRDRRRLLRRTLIEPFAAVPGMAAVYTNWADRGARFHYVSGSPWQLYEPLADFIRVEKFPAGTFHLRKMRLTDRTLAEIFKSPREHKLRVIGGLMRDFPRRRFVLVGDSGEEDPEIYGELARTHPDQARRILIRDVTSEGRGAARYAAAFREVPPVKWAVFARPEEIANAVAAVSAP